MQYQCVWGEDHRISARYHPSVCLRWVVVVENSFPYQGQLLKYIRIFPVFLKYYYGSFLCLSFLLYEKVKIRHFLSLQIATIARGWCKQFRTTKFRIPLGTCWDNYCLVVWCWSKKKIGQFCTYPGMVVSGTYPAIPFASVRFLVYICLLGFNSDFQCLLLTLSFLFIYSCVYSTQVHIWTCIF